MTPVLLNQPPGAFSFYSQRTTGFTVSAIQLGTVFDCSGTSFAVTAAPSLGAGFQFEVYASGSNTYTVTASSGTIQGPAGSATTLALTTGQGAVFESDGTNWKVVSAVGLGSTSGAAIIVKDNAFTVIGDVDATKKFVFQVDTQATASTMTYDVGAQTAGRTVTVPVLTASGSFAFQNFLNVFTAQQTIDISGTAGALPAQIFASGTPGAYVGAVTNILEGVAWAGQGWRMIGRLAGGSRGADAATPGSAQLVTMQGYGYDGTSWISTPNAVYSLVTDGLWSGTNRGTYHLWSATANGATASGEVMRLQSGNLLIGTTTNITGAGGIAINSATMITTRTSFTNGAAAALGTLTNAPTAGNPTKWIPINDNGTTRYLPAW